MKIKCWAIRAANGELLEDAGIPCLYKSRELAQKESTLVPEDTIVEVEVTVTLTP